MSFLLNVALPPITASVVWLIVWNLATRNYLCSERFLTPLELALNNSYYHITCELIHPWTTAEHSGPVWPPYPGTETTDHADLVKLVSTQLSLMSLHSTLVWQLPIIEHRIYSCNVQCISVVSGWSNDKFMTNSPSFIIISNQRTQSHMNNVLQWAGLYHSGLNDAKTLSARWQTLRSWGNLALRCLCTITSLHSQSLTITHQQHELF